MSGKNLNLLGTTLPEKYLIISITLMSMTIGSWLILFINDWQVTPLVVWVLIVFVATHLLSLLVGTWLYAKRAKKIGKQFYNTLQSLENFDVDHPSQVELEVSSIPEINELNYFVLKVTDRLRQHDSANRQFTESAALELKTPLIAIKKEAEKLKKNGMRHPEELKALDEILYNTSRLAKMNHDLILLSNIEHGAFHSVQTVDINQLIEEELNSHSSQIKANHLEIIRNFQRVIVVEMSIDLGRMLIKELLNNAIFHNEKNGFIEISTYENLLEITNSGPPSSCPPETLFHRFKRGHHKENHIGLGLSIVERICKFYQFEVEYLFFNNAHTLRVGV